MPKVEAIVVAAGSGRRMGGIDKLALMIGGKSVLQRSVEAVLCTPGIGRLILCVRQQDVVRLGLWLEQLPARGDKPFAVIAGGEERSQTVQRSLDALSSDCEYVLIHDAARPMCTVDIMERALSLVKAHGAVMAGTKAQDTIKQVDEFGRISQTPPREEMWHGQTPQVFRRDWLIKAHKIATEQNWPSTDDAMLLEKCGYDVHIFDAGQANIKITHPQDLLLARVLVSNGPPIWRAGHGIDAHRLVEGRRLILCGVDIPFEKGLFGHSDADVATHALMDALLGAAGLGDIGLMFPDTDACYKDADSVELLCNVMEHLHEASWQIGNADITIVAQKPKISPYRDRMREKLAAAMGIEISQISVKATTTEGMGYEGSGEGITAHAMVMLVKET